MKTKLENLSVELFSKNVKNLQFYIAMFQLNDLVKM